MADLSVTAANVRYVSGGTFDGTAGATITAGQTVYLDSADNLLKLADDDVSAVTADVRGIALHGSANGQPLRIQTGGVINLGATLTLGEAYALSDTPGGIRPWADLGTGDRVFFLGIGQTAANLLFNPFNANVVHA